jgi:lipopolysaccharide transport system permease protein
MGLATTDSRPATRRTVLIRPTPRLPRLDVAETWRCRELLYHLVVRELKLRYKQASIGVAWAVIQPVLAVSIFALIFGHFAKMPSGGVPYFIFAFTAILPWTYFAEAARRSTLGLIGDSELIRKVYFPRLILPLATVVAPLVDFAIGFIILLILCVWNHVPLTPNLAFLPLFLMVALLLALSIGLWLGPLSVRHRDVIVALPFVIQVWLYASPVAYPISIVPERWRLLYSLNPMVGVIEGFRWVLLGSAPPNGMAMLTSGVVIAAVLIFGLVYFRKMERSFADVI